MIPTSRYTRALALLLLLDAALLIPVLGRSTLSRITYSVAQMADDALQLTKFCIAAFLNCP